MNCQFEVFAFTSSFFACTPIAKVKTPGSGANCPSGKAKFFLNKKHRLMDPFFFLRFGKKIENFVRGTESGTWGRCLIPPSWPLACWLVKFVIRYKNCPRQFHVFSFLYPMDRTRYTKLF